MAITLPTPSPSPEYPVPSSSTLASSDESRPSTRKAWATLVTKPDYVAGLLTLHRTLVSVSAYPLIVMTTPTLPESSRRTIARAGIQIVDVDSLHPPSHQHAGFENTFARFEDTWTKLRVFELEEYETLILIDSDMIFLRSMDELFDDEHVLPGKDWVAAVPACVCNPLKIDHYPSDWIPANCSFALQPSPTTLHSPPIPPISAPRTSHLLNSGLVLLHPSSTTMSRLTTYLNTSPDVASFHFPDQELLAEVFKGRWRPLPWWTNALKTLRAVHQDLWQDDEVRLIHYILDKPWAHRPAHLPPHQSSLGLPPTPTSNQSSSPASPSPSESKGYFTNPARRPLPPNLTDAVHNTAAQKGARSYDAVHAWWWIVYEDMLDEMKAQGEESGWREMDAWVKH